MSQSIDVHKIATLARLQLKPEEKELLKEKFSKIKEYIDILNEVVIEDQMLEKDDSAQIIFYEDTVIKSNVRPKDFSKNIENEHFKVPKVIE